jgi:hypothetical protein
VGVSKSPLFATETLRIYSITSWNYFYYSVKTFFVELVPCIFLMAGENSKRVLAGENSKRVIELVLYIFLMAGENSKRVRGCREGGRQIGFFHSVCKIVFNYSPTTFCSRVPRRTIVV